MNNKLEYSLGMSQLLAELLAMSAAVDLELMDSASSKDQVLELSLKLTRRIRDEIGSRNF